MKNIRKLLALSVIAGAGCFFINATNTYAADFVVTSTDDTSDSSLDGTCDDGTGECTLKAAIEEINDIGDGSNAITFDIAPLDQTIKTINTTTGYSLNFPTNIDGETQDDASCGELVPSLPAQSNQPHVLRVQITGSGSETVFSGDLSGSTIKGLIINNIQTGFYGTPNNLHIHCNYIGTDSSGSTDLGNVSSPIDLYAGVDPDTLEINDNLIVSTDSGISLDGGGNIHHNIIGVAADGKARLREPDIDSRSAIQAQGGSIYQNVIGSYGVGIDASGDSVSVHGNHVGTGLTGTEILGNITYGLGIESNSGEVYGNTIVNNGDLDLTEVGIPPELFDVYSAYLTGILVMSDGVNYHNNTIADNGSNGITVFQDGTTNTFSQNSMFNNGGLGIDLMFADFDNGTVENIGVNPNDPGDSDTGANDYLNFPTVKKLSHDGNKVSGAFDLDVNDGEYPDGYLVEFYLSNKSDSSGYGEGQYYMGSVEVSGDVSGEAFTMDSPVELSGNMVVTATTTAKTGPTTYGSTSEFSPVANFESPQLAESGEKILIALGAVPVLIASLNLIMRRKLVYKAL